MNSIFHHILPEILAIFGILAYISYLLFMIVREHRKSFTGSRSVINFSKEARISN